MTDELTPFHVAISNLCCTSCTYFPHPPKIFSIPSLAQEIIWVFSHISLIMCSLIKPHSFLNPWILATQEWWHFNGRSLEHCLSMGSPRTVLGQIWMQIVYLKVNARCSNREIKKWDRERQDTNTICYQASDLGGLPIGAQSRWRPLGDNGEYTTELSQPRGGKAGVFIHKFIDWGLLTKV